MRIAAIIARARRAARRTLRAARRRAAQRRTTILSTAGPISPSQFLAQLAGGPGSDVLAGILSGEAITISATKHGPVVAVAKAIAPREHRESTLAALADLIEGAALQYFLIPAASPASMPSIGLRAGDAAAALRAIAQDETRGWYAGFRSVDDDDAEASRLVATFTEADITRAASSPAVLLWTYRELSAPSSLLGRRCSVRIDFWDEGPGRRLTARAHNPVGRVLGASARTTAAVTVGTRTYRSLAVLAQQRWNQVQFPIDVVYTWVDGGDPAWAARRAHFDAESAQHAAESVDAARFRQRDELRHSLRSIDAYAPWVQHIYLVTDRQIPQWLDASHPGITVVDHTDIFEAGDLPTFNSHAIEARLHHIEGLAEHYLYFNDDMLLGRPVAPELFFLSNGMPKFFPSRNTTPLTEDDESDDALLSARRHSQAVLRGAFGTAPHHIFRHAPYPQSRSLLHDLEARFPQEFAKTASSRFRAGGDIIITSWIHAYGGYFLGRAVPDEIVYGYIDPGTPEGLAKLPTLLTRPVDTLCINDTHDGDAESAAPAIEDFFARFLPTPSRFERT
ncbi:MAG: stealth family protein [Sporichthyaceae bacterium]